MSHLFAHPHDEAELLEFARRIGLKVDWFQRNVRHPHFDVSQTKRRQAIAAGAIAITAREGVELRYGSYPTALVIRGAGKDVD